MFYGFTLKKQILFQEKWWGELAPPCPLSLRPCYEVHMMYSKSYKRLMYVQFTLFARGLATSILLILASVLLILSYHPFT